MSKPQDLFALLEELEKLPAPTKRLDAKRAAILGSSTNPQEAFDTAVEATFAILEAGGGSETIDELVHIMTSVTKASPHQHQDVQKAAMRAAGWYEATPAPFVLAVPRSPVPPPPPMHVPFPEAYNQPKPKPIRTDSLKEGPEYKSKQWKAERAQEIKDLDKRIKDPKHTWVTGDSVNREGLNAFIHIVRSPTDPERAPRVKGADTKAWRKKLEKGSLKEWRKKLLETLSKEGPMTFNKLSLLTSGYTADIAQGKDPDVALWSLVQDGLVEHTLEIPIHFRIRVRAKGAKTLCGV